MHFYTTIGHNYSCYGNERCSAACCRGSKSCCLHVMTPNRPLIFTGNNLLVFAPYHTHYPQLEVHMRQVGLQPSPNNWDQPFYAGTS